MGNFKTNKPANTAREAAILCLVLTLLSAAGCRTPDSQTRRQERPEVYPQLNAEHQALVDQGKIERGMTRDAVFLAWGQASEVLQAEDEIGLQEIWLYRDAYLRSRPYWTTYSGYYRPADCPAPIYFAYDAMDYVKAEIVFQNGVVVRWRTLPKPTR